jgi:hypothetical protein
MGFGASVCLTGHGSPEAIRLNFRRMRKPCLRCAALLQQAGCDGCLIVQERGELADLICNVCSAVVDTMPIERAGARLMELASSEICSARCPHCGALNTFPGFSAIEAFICSECGEGVNAEGPIQ